MDAKINTYTLKNGIKVLIVPLKTKLTFLSVSMLLGSRHEKNHAGNLTHYYEHLLGRITSQKYKDYKYIGNEIAKRGGNTNAYVSEYELIVFIQGYFKDFDFYADILSNSLKDFYIDPKLAENEKGAVIQELKNIISNERYDFDYKVFKYLFPKYAYLEDFKSDIKYVKKYNVRLVKNFIKKKILTENIVLNITCPRNKIKQTKYYIKKYFGIIKKTSNGNIKYPVLQNKTGKTKVVHIKNKVVNDNNNTIINIYAFAEMEYLSKEHIKHMILHNILFNFDNGVFYKELREKMGVIYNIHLHDNISIKNAKESYYYIGTRCDIKNAPTVIAKIIDILKTYKINPNDIKYSKNRILSRYEYSKFYNIDSYNGFYKNFLLYNKKLRTNKDIYDAIKNTTNKEVLEYYEKFKENIIKRSTIFYYSHKNINDKINNKLNNKIAII
jgi:predicted Zn-dependent peptidase